MKTEKNILIAFTPSPSSLNNEIGGGSALAIFCLLLYFINLCILSLGNVLAKFQEYFIKK